MKPSLRFKFLVAVALLTMSGLAAAQDQSADPPGRVARLQFIEGQVSMQPGGVDDWVDAGLNRPLTTADRIWIDRNARAELTIASAALRLGSETSLTITNLNDNTAQIELDQGTLSLSVRDLNEGDVVEVDTPNVAFTVLQPGEYRFDVMPNADQTSILVRRGEGQASGPNGAMDVPSGPALPVQQRAIAGVYGHGCDATRFLRGMGCGAREAGDFVALGSICCPRNGRLRGSGRQRFLGAGAGVWRGVVSKRGSGLGSLPRRPLGLGGAVGVDLGG